jgi:hypothetical protein
MGSIPYGEDSPLLAAWSFNIGQIPINWKRTQCSLRCCPKVAVKTSH